MLRTLIGTIVCLALAGNLSAADPVEKKDAAAKAEKGPQWKLAVQAYSFNRFTFFEAVDKAKELGLKYIEAYPGQVLSKEDKSRFTPDASPEVREKVKAKLKEAGLTLVNFGVVDLGQDEKSARKVFDFAKDMGVKTIVAEPDPKLMDTLDKLTEEYQINVAIHNHPKPSRYWSPDTVLEALKGRGKRIGACADTGHWIRSGLDPLECLKKLEGRIISLHFKDLNEKSPKAHDVPWGTGVSGVKDLLTELKRQNFAGVFSIEYEYNWENSMPEIAECIKGFHQFAKELGVKTKAMK
ncbi:MAG TPA: sugar phosphate isomerase/epimerase family protein [Phycisphaerae bacterium]|nr:sugar phosphate isomerase/epimerase [Phycisphaerae bacterium]HOB75434.1 sugar phosphate isomerase/epimerase family protein [Phycisphaerae bacterium]HOJ55633.1 sugar phosphate isomerase/epimerase family protein [Phycisphaerae bacterium]HOL27644.1 sugar phosphate isomerase/epimerase family protein [Phycisphaerae bacterium]HPP21946.1 sugar phosphate isomerase/epimerase family protein [Phycisphaerae bacterium]